MLEKHKNPDGTYNGLAVMAEVSGLPVKSMHDIWRDVKANQARLDGCAFHEFSPIQPRVPANQRYRCIECGGEVDYHGWFWHEKGRRPG